MMVQLYEPWIYCATGQAIRRLFDHDYKDTFGELPSTIFYILIDLLEIAIL
jgi:hypothetical protein